MKNNTIIILFLFSSIAFFVNAIFYDEEIAPYTYTIYSSNKDYSFKMNSDSSGIAYQIRNTRYKKEMWKTNGWYSFQTFITDDGKYLIRLGNWPRGESPSEKDLAIAFYNKGKLIKSYSTRELIKNDSLVVVTVSHYMFMKDEPSLTDYYFQLKTIDEIVYEFDVRTGEILSGS